MKIILQILFLYCVFPSLLVGQFSDNFSDGDFTNNPTWSGNVEDFRVNEINELQSDAEEAGSSVLSVMYDITPDFTWSMNMEMDFAPSGSNKLEVYFMVSDLDFGQANGYMFEVGESLSDDAINIYRLDGGVKTLLATGETGAMGQKPAIASMKLERVEGLWTLFTDYDKLNAPIEELSFFDDTYDFITSAHFAIKTNYTNSNVKNFYFDDIIAKAFEPDVTGPTFVNAEIISANSILITLDESILASSLEELNVTLTPNIPLANSATFGSQPNQIIITFAENFQSGIDYILQFQGLKDENNNLMAPAQFSFQTTDSPVAGDIVVNEILFDPRTGGDDFVEIINISNKLLDLKGLQILNSTKTGSEEFIEASLLLAPDEILAFTADTMSTIDDYDPPANARLYEMKIPTFNVASGNVTLLDTAGNLIDSFYYEEDFHVSFLDDSKGVSLERIFPTSATTAANFSSGVESTNYATPGYKNANFQAVGAKMDGNFIIENTVFSPNGDGDDDLLFMQMNLPSSAYLTTIRVYNIGGQVVKTINNNQLTGSEDLVTWDGTLDDGGKAPIGHYIITLEAFNENGDTLKSKKHVKLLDFF